MEGREAVRHLCDDWLAANAIYGRPGPNASQSVSVVLSMAPGTDPDRVQDAARAWARANLGNHEWIMVRHDDQEHPHVHVTVRAVGRDGKRLAPGKEQLQAWREDFARELRARGVKAEATPRQARGHAGSGRLIRSTGCSSAVSNRASSRSRRPSDRRASPGTGTMRSFGRTPSGRPTWRMLASCEKAMPTIGGSPAISSALCPTCRLHEPGATS